MPSGLLQGLELRFQSCKGCRALGCQLGSVYMHASVKSASGWTEQLHEYSCYCTSAYQLLKPSP